MMISLLLIFVTGMHIQPPTFEQNHPRILRILNQRVQLFHPPQLVVLVVEFLERRVRGRREMCEFHSYVFVCDCDDVVLINIIVSLIVPLRF